MNAIIAPSEPYYLNVDSEEIFPEDFTSVILMSSESQVISQAQLTSTICLWKAKLHTSVTMVYC